MDLEDLRLAVYESFSRDGRAPSKSDLAVLFEVAPAEVDVMLTQLADARHLVLADGEILMAHPFSSVPLGFSVMGTSALWWGGARGIRLRFRTCCQRRRPCSWRRDALPAATLMLGRSV